MKKTPAIVLGLVLIMLITAGCSSAATVPTQLPAATSAPAADESAAPVEIAATPEVKPTSYKESMLPFDQLVPGERIVILQNTLNYSREGFYTAETKPVASEINYDGETISAYPMSYLLAFLKNGMADTVKVFNNDGSEQELTADEFKGLFVIVDFTSDAAPILYNPETGTKLEDFLYAITSEGEAIYSIVSGSIHNAAAVIANAGWDTDATYRYVATDKFYFPVGPEENATGEVRGTLSGAVNGSFPDLKIASGKINDLIYIEVIQ